MMDVSSPKLKLAAKIFHIHSYFADLFSYFFCSYVKISNFELELILFFKTLIKQKPFKVCCIHYQIYLIQKI